jgi:hypothetical protein
LRIDRPIGLPPFLAGPDWRRADSRQGPRLPPLMLTKRPPPRRLRPSRLPIKIRLILLAHLSPPPGRCMAPAGFLIEWRLFVARRRCASRPNMMRSVTHEHAKRRRQQFVVRACVPARPHLFAARPPPPPTRSFKQTLELAAPRPRRMETRRTWWKFSIMFAGHQDARQMNCGPAKGRRQRATIESGNQSASRRRRIELAEISVLGRSLCARVSLVARLQAAGAIAAA